MKYGIINKSKIELYANVSTKDSIFPVIVKGTPFRTFTTREAARNYKQSLKTPTNYAIVRGCTVVR